MSLRSICNIHRNSNLNAVINKFERFGKFRMFAESANDDCNRVPGISTERKNTVGQTSILVQQGSDIQELPVILRKIKSDEFITIWSENILKTQNIDKIQSADQVNQIEIKYDDIIELLNNCVTSIGILSIINEIPNNILSPEIASYAFDRLIKNETIIGLRNLEQGSPVFEKLITCILKGGDQTMLLDIMEVLKTFLDLQKTVQRFCDELLLRNSDGVLTVIEICECIERFIDCKQQSAAEKFWTGLSDAEKSIDDKNIKFVYKILPKLKISRRLVLGILERRISCFWYQLSSEAVSESINALAKMDSSCHAIRTLQYFARWLNTNIHAVNSKNLELIIKAFTDLDYSNSEIEKAMSRYVKAKGIKITSESLTLAILDHCQHFRLRNNVILNGCSEIFICNSRRFSPVFLKSIIKSFGFLNHQPLNGIMFWQTAEQYLKENFQKTKPTDLIEIFLNCCYLEIYPMNFVNSVFSPNFLDLIHSTIETDKLPKFRSDLKLLDTALTIEVATYNGPLLPKDHHAKSIWQDGRIKRILNSIIVHLENLAGGIDNMTKNVIIGKLPTNPLYIVDILIHPPGFKSYTFNIHYDFNVLVAILILIPEYYDSKGEFLIGPQYMRIRHLRKLGIKVATLDFEKLAKLRIHPIQLDNYLVERMKVAYPVIPTNDNINT